jgi:ABC-type uncharacterized transport system permease subunit
MTDPWLLAIAVSGTFTASGSPALSVHVTPAHGHLDAGSHSIISHTSGANAAMNGIAAQITAANGTPFNTRQTVAVNGNTAGQVNVVVTGEEATRIGKGMLPVLSATLLFQTTGSKEICSIVIWIV